MAQALTPRAIEWAASLIVKEMPDDELNRKYNTKTNATANFISRISTRGLKVLTIKELKWVWNGLKVEDFVRNNTVGYKTHMSGQQKKDDLVTHIQQYLVMPESSQLVPHVNTDAAIAAQPATAMPAATRTVHQELDDHFREYLISHRFPMGEGGGVAPYHFAFHPPRPPPSGSAAVAAAPFTAYRTAGAATHWVNNTGSASSGSARKRKAPPSLNPPQNPILAPPPNNNPWAAASLPEAAAALAAALEANVEASLEASSSDDNSSGDPTEASKKALESRILGELKMMGFQDETECLDAIRHAMESSDEPPTSETVMFSIISQREEKEEARKMDEARLLSEEHRKEESERLREQRREEEETTILNATFSELLGEDRFGESWLLQYKPSKPLCEDICNNRSQTETKRSLIKLLKQEKNCRKWWTGLPKAYFTCVAGTRLLHASSGGDVAAVKREIEAINEEVERAVSFHSEQNKDGVPNIFIEAKSKATDQAPGESTASSSSTVDDDSNDEVIMLTDEEVRRHNLALGGVRPPVDSAGRVVDVL